MEDQRNIFGLFNYNLNGKGQIFLNITGECETMRVLPTKVQGCKDLYMVHARVNSQVVKLEYGTMWDESAWKIKKSAGTTIHMARGDALVMGDWGSVLQRTDLEPGTLGIFLHRHQQEALVEMSGDVEELGGWNPNNAPATTPLKPGVSATPVLFKQKTTLQYKCISKEDVVVWEERPFVNKSVETPSGPFIVTSEWGGSNVAITAIQESERLSLGDGPVNVARARRNSREHDMGDMGDMRDALRDMFWEDIQVAHEAFVLLPCDSSAEISLESTTNSEAFLLPTPTGRPSLRRRIGKVLRRLFRCRGGR